MSAKKKKKKSSGQGTSFVITLVTLSIVFVFFGYLIGQYAVGALKEQHEASMQVARQSTSAPVVARESNPTPVSTVNPTSSTPVQSTQPKASTQPEPSSSSGTLYRVQVGVFSERANADRMVAMLKEAGYEGIVIPGPPHRVQTGAFSSQENASKLVDELVKKGFEAIVVR